MDSYETWLFGATLRTIGGTLGKVDPEKRGRVLDEARKVLLNPDPEALRGFMRRVESTRLSRQDRDQLYQEASRAVGSKRLLKRRKSFSCLPPAYLASRG